MRDRVSRLEHVPASSLVPHPLNWRTHPNEQRDTLLSILRTVGFVGLIRVFQQGDKYVIIDGHLRQDVSGDQLVPVLVLDLTPEEAKLLLLTGDELSSLAETNREATERLIDEIRESGAELPEQVDNLLNGLLEDEAAAFDEGDYDLGEDEGDAGPNTVNGELVTSAPVSSVERPEPTEVRFRRYMIHCDRATFDLIQQNVIAWANDAGLSDGWGDALVANLVSQLTGGG